MKCQSCNRSGEVRDAFKRVSFRRFPWGIYYICNKCGKANRPETLLNPKQRGNKQIVKLAGEIHSRYKASSEQVTFSILIWGPGSGNEETRKVYEKRKQIRDSLKEKGMNAFFSEDIVNPTDLRGRSIPYDVAELIQAETVDLVINIAASHGSLLEAQKINTKLLHRCLLWLPEAAKGGFASSLCNFLENLGMSPLYFNDSDIKSCVLTLGSEDWVEGLRINDIGLSLEEKMIQESKIRRDRPRLQ